MCRGFSKSAVIRTSVDLLFILTAAALACVFVLHVWMFFLIWAHISIPFLFPTLLFIHFKFYIIESLQTLHTLHTSLPLFTSAEKHFLASVQSLSRVRLFATHEPQHVRPPCPSPTPGVHPNSCPLSWCCHPTISSCRPHLLLSSIFPSIRIFSNESVPTILHPSSPAGFCKFH